MDVMTRTGHPQRPPSPWSGSQHADRHRWQLDGTRDLDGAVALVRATAAELLAAHLAGWRLDEPMRNGHLVASRPSRRARAAAPAPDPDPRPAAAPRLPPWRLRVVDEPAGPGDVALDLGAAASTPVLRVVAGDWRQVSGPDLGPSLREAVRERTARLDPGGRDWAVAPARVGPQLDLVADGAALRLHAVRGGRLVRTIEAVTFQHAADRATSLPEAAAAYRRTADVLAAMAAAGGRLLDADDGLVRVAWPEEPS